MVKALDLNVGELMSELKERQLSTKGKKELLIEYFLNKSNNKLGIN